MVPNSLGLHHLSGYDSVREFKVTGVIMDLVHLPDERGVGSDIFIHCCGYVRACVRIYPHHRTRTGDTKSARVTKDTKGISRHAQLLSYTERGNDVACDVIELQFSLVCWGGFPQILRGQRSNNELLTIEVHDRGDGQSFCYLSPTGLVKTSLSRAKQAKHSHGLE